MLCECVECILKNQLKLIGENLKELEILIKSAKKQEKKQKIRNKLKNCPIIEPNEQEEPSIQNNNDNNDNKEDDDIDIDESLLNTSDLQLETGGSLKMIDNLTNFNINQIQQNTFFFSFSSKKKSFFLNSVPKNEKMFCNSY